MSTSFSSGRQTKALSEILVIPGFIITFLIWFLIAFQEESLEKENQLFVEETGYRWFSSVEIESGP